MKRFLPTLLATITGKPRYMPEIKWSGNSCVHNIFRFIEMLFGAPAVMDKKTGIITAKIVPQISASVVWYKGKILSSTYQAHSFEGACALTETWIRGLLKFRVAIPIKIWIPKLSSANGLPNLTDSFMFAIAFDAAGGRSFSSSATTLTYSHTCTGSNGLLVSCWKTDTTDNITSDKYAGVTMTQTDKVQLPALDRWGYMYHLVGPATGANNIVITEGYTPDFIIAKSGSYSGAKQTAQPDAHSNNTVAAGTSITLTLTVVAANSWVVAYAWDSNSPAASTNVTDRHSDGTPDTFGDSNAAVAAGSYSQVFTDSLRAMAGVQGSFAPALVVNPFQSSFMTKQAPQRAAFY